MDELEREEYLLHSRSRAYKKRLMEAMDAVEKAIVEHPGTWAVSYSGGKDSTVMLNICYECGWRGPVLYQTYGDIETIPDNRKMVDWVKSHYGLEVIEKDAPGEFEIFRELGYFFIEAESKEEQAAVRRWYRRAFGELDKFVQAQGWTGQFLGLRIEESHQRVMVLGHRGDLYYASTRKNWTACPLYRWSGRDIWAYLVSRGLPWSSIYDAPGQNRERLRNDVVFLAGSGSIRHGQFAFWAKYFPELFEKLAYEWPEIKNYI